MEEARQRWETKKVAKVVKSSVLRGRVIEVNRRFQQHVKEITECRDKFLTKYNLRDSDWNTTLQYFDIEQIKARKHFVKQGYISDKLGFVKSGLLRAFVYNHSGEEITTQFYLPKSIAIAMESFNERVPAQENIVAVEDSELVTITFEKLQELFKIVPLWQKICKETGDQKNKDLIQRTVQLQTLTAKEHYTLFCRTYPEVIEKVALRHIASYLGIDIATLSRIRRKK